MRNFISLALILFISLGIIMSDAEARRFGGGRSFGAYRPTNSFSRVAPNAAPFRNPAASPARNSWLGPIAGLAAGGLLASLFMGNGIGSGMVSWLLVAGIAMLLINLLRSFSRARVQPAPMYNTNYQHAAPQQYAASADFDQTEFIRQAKVQFIRLQAAYDHQNLQDIRQFTTPEVFAEIKLQLQDRGNAENITDVVTLNANIMDIRTEGNAILASVQFFGLIKEDPNEAAAPFKEIWHFRQEANSLQCLVSGIQQDA